ncbi:MAG TPA: helix-turn-helix transcriptional regulator, partial [Microbacterium sp.]|nr:helix-turn-helix transcriptional regulator [Microbacterium sp.]
PEQISSQASLALAAAPTHLVDGDRDRLEHWLDTAERLLAAGQELEASPATCAVLRAGLARGGASAMADAAATAYELAAEDHPWRPLACTLRGAGLHLLGDRARAVPVLEEGARRGGVVAPSAQVLCLAQLALIRADDEDWEEAALLASRARAQLERAGVSHYPSSALAFAVSALVRAHRDRVEAAQDDRRQAQELLARLVDPPPWYALETRVALARTMLRLGDATASRTLLSQAERLLHAVADAPLAARWVEDARHHADTFATSVLAGPASLTNAELRVLRLLPTHLSFREMGLYLHVTANTVKTHAHAVYRKLDASSRSEAVVQARDIGLLDDVGAA